MPIPEAIAIPMVAKYLDDNRVFNASDITRNAVKPMLDELARWTDALKPLRSPVA